MLSTRTLPLAFTSLVTVGSLATGCAVGSVAIVGVGGAGGSTSSSAGHGGAATTASTGNGGGSGGASSSSSSSGTSFTTSSSSASSTTTVSSAGVGGAAAAAALGLACAQDSDCGAPLHCILPTANDPTFGGGPAGGYCSEPCMKDADCPQPNGSCLLGTSGPGDCVPQCTLGPTLKFINDPLDPNKCHGRQDLRCTPINTTGTVLGCVPTCGENTQCPAGEVCDPRKAVCVPTASQSTGLPNGSTCNPNASTPQCAAVCVSFTGTAPVTLCTENCVLGGQSTQTSPNCGGDSKGLCAFSPTGNGAGDFGFCAPACLHQSDCQNPNFWCFPITNLTGTGPGEVPNGWCFGATACPNGASDCTAQAGTTCKQTSGGPFCLNPMFP